LLEVLDRRGLVAEDGQLVLNQRVLEDGEIGKGEVAHAEKMRESAIPG
jgi:hypothetical protein